MSAVRKHQSLNNLINEKSERKAMKEEQARLIRLAQGKAKSKVKRHERMFTDDDCDMSAVSFHMED